MKIDGELATRRLFLLLFSAGLLLLFLDVQLNVNRGIDSSALRRIFNITREDSLASWLMVLQTGFAALALMFIAVIRQQQAAASTDVIAWVLLALFFLYLSADDGARIHERLGSLVDSDRSPKGLANAFPSYGWQVLVLPWLVLCGALMYLFLWRQMDCSRQRAYLTLAVVLMGCAVGLDFLEGLAFEHNWNPQHLLSETLGISPRLIRHYGKAVEEWLEMLAMSLLLMVFVRQLLRAVAPAWTIEIRARRQVD